MPSQGSLDLLREPLAKELLSAGIPAHLAYTWKDGTPESYRCGFIGRGTPSR